MSGWLEGMRVLDVSVWRPMPHATQILCDLGAEVLKIEPPGGDPMRQYPEIFASVARNKRSIELDLKTPEGRARADELVVDCDVFCEGFRPGVAARLGLDYERLSALRPGLVYCSISGYGQSGPMRDAPAHDLNYQALAGAVAPRGREEPRIPRLPVADLEAGTLAALAICAAWGRVHGTGEGEFIDVAMADAVHWWVGPSSGVAVEGASGPTQGSPGYGVFATADGGWLSLAPLSEPHLWTAICHALDLDDLLDVSFGDRLSRVAEIHDRIAAVVARLPRDDAVARLLAQGAPAAPVLTPEEAATHPQFVEREALIEADGVSVAAFPVHLERRPRRGAGRLPAIGEHPEGFSPRP